MLLNNQERFNTIAEEKSLVYYQDRITRVQFAVANNVKAFFKDLYLENNNIIDLSSDEFLYIEYNDGSYIFLSSDEGATKIKKQNIAQAIYSADWGYILFNATDEIKYDDELDFYFV